MFSEPWLTDLVRALLAIGAALMLPIVLYFGIPPVIEEGTLTISQPMQAYLDVLTAVVAFYFSQTP